MAERNPPSFLQAGSHSAENDRLTLGGLTYAQPAAGVLSVSDASAMKLTAAGGLTTSVAAGWGEFQGTNVAVTQGKYRLFNDAAEVMTHSTQHATNDRIDLIVARVYDAAYIGGILNEWDLEVVPGTPAGAPAAPALPANSVAIAEVLIKSTAGGGGTIVTGNITDKRKYATALGGDIVALTTDTITPTRPGMSRFDTDKNQVQRRNAADSAWLPMGNHYIVAIASAPSPAPTGARLTDPATFIEYVYNGTNWIQLTPAGSRVDTGEARNNAAYGGLTTAQAVTLKTGTKVLVSLMFDILSATLGAQAGSGVAVSGATTIAANAGGATWQEYNAVANYYQSGGGIGMITGLTPGDNTFTAQWATNASITFYRRGLHVIPLPA